MSSSSCLLLTTRIKLFKFFSCEKQVEDAIIQKVGKKQSNSQLCLSQWRKAGQRLLIPLSYSHQGKCEHSEVQSHPPLCDERSTLHGFRRYAHAQVIADFKNIADYYEG